MKTKNNIVLITLFAAFCLVSMQNAIASSIRVKCEVRSSPLRSKVSVDGNVAPGWYFAQIKSGTGVKTSAQKPTDSSQEVQFNFDSNPSDIKAGATAIPANFIVNRTVTGYIRKTGTNVILGVSVATCDLK